MSTPTPEKDNGGDDSSIFIDNDDSNRRTIADGLDIPSSLLATVNMRVTGMMCQKNCGTTVENSLKTIPGTISARAVHSGSYATLTVNLHQFSSRHHHHHQDQKNNFSALQARLEGEALDAIESVGFDCRILGPDEDLELQREDDEDDDEDGRGEIVPMLSSSSSSLFDGDDEKDGNDNEKKKKKSSAVFEVGGMSCAVCTGRVERLLTSVPGVERATVSLPTSRAKAEFRDGMLECEDLAEQCKNVVRKEGGYSCEVIHIQRADEDGKNSGGGITLQANAAKMEEARTRELNSWKESFIISAVFTIPLVIIHYTTSASHSPPGAWVDWVSFYLATPVQFGTGKRFYYSAYKSFANGRVIGMDFLVVLGTSAAYLYSILVFGMKIFGDYDNNNNTPSQEKSMKPTFETGAMLLTFVTLGKFLEAYARGKTASALQTLMELQPLMACRVTIPPSAFQPSDDKTTTRLQSGVSINSFPTTQTSIENVQVGDYILVIPGARIPADGILIASSSSNSNSNSNKNNTAACYVDESALTGEPFPVAKHIGSTLYGSTVNQLSTLLLKITATGSETALSRIVRLVEEAQCQRAPIQIQADAIASIFAPCVIFLSSLTFLAWMIFNHVDENSPHAGHERWFVAFMSAISVVVVACPCALGLATPTAVMVGTGVGATNGLLIKGGKVLEEAYGVGCVVFDKTGTITTGMAVLEDRVEFLENDDEDVKRLLDGLPKRVDRSKDVSLWLASCAEKNSDHPLSSAIINSAKGLWGSDVVATDEGFLITDSSVVPGSGVECLLSKTGQGGEDWGKWWVRVGNRAWAKAPVHQGDVAEHDMNSFLDGDRTGDDEINSIRVKGRIGVYISILPHSTNTTKPTLRHHHHHRRRKLIAIFGIVDSIQSTAKSTVSALRNHFQMEVWMCTGDDERTALAVAREVGIDEDNVCAGVSPEGKADLITRLQKRRRGGGTNNKNNNNNNQNRNSVAVVGDGINDSIALARANVGIALGAGTEVAVEAADVVLIRSSLHDVVVALHLSRVVFRRIRYNFCWALGYNMMALPFAAGALVPLLDWRLPPAFAGLMMAFSSISVVGSSLLLKFYKRPVVGEDGGLDGPDRSGGAGFCGRCGERVSFWGGRFLFHGGTSSNVRTSNRRTSIDGGDDFESSAAFSTSIQIM